MFYVKAPSAWLMLNFLQATNMKRLDLKENIEKLVKSGKTYEVISKELKDQNPDLKDQNPVISLQHQCDVFVMIIRSIRSHYWKKKN